ncbi:MAG: SpoVA/SpoVAEb family sporulation membrane protein [Bacillota bacterium]|nr:SpoVA/SpoVAEb family sporulation membrane protein [Bacillota bacterium]
MTFLWAFLVGGALSALAQLVVDVGRMTPAQTLVGFVVLGGVASVLGLYAPLVRLAGAGATVPLTGFGHVLVQGTIADIARHGWMGIFSGGLEAAAVGVTVAIAFSYLVALLAQPKA